MKLLKTRKSVMAIIISLLMIAGGSFGCARMAVNMAGRPLVSNLLENIQDFDSVRLLKDGLAGDLIFIAAMTEMSPNNYDLLARCSFSFAAYALMVEDEDPEYAKELLAIGKEYGYRALKQNRKFAKGLKEGKKVYELAGDLPKKYADALCWTAFNHGFILFLNMDDPTIYIELADVVSMLKRSREIDETFYFGATTALMAAYYSIIPKALDPDSGPENSAKSFDEARKISGGKLLLIDYFEARFLAVAMDDEGLFEKRLKYVINADSGGAKGVRAFNELAKIKAKHFLDHKDEHF